MLLLLKLLCKLESHYQICPAPLPVMLSGATGDKAPYINGAFDPILPPEFTDGQPTYVKRNDPVVFAAYCKSIESWCIQPKKDKGSSICYAYFKTKQRFEESSTGDSFRRV